MANYKYSGIDIDGNNISSTIVALNKEKAIELLFSKNIEIIEINKEFKFSGAFVTIKQKPNFLQLTAILRQLSLMIKAGVTLVIAVEIVERATENKILQEQIYNLLQLIRGGNPLSVACKTAMPLFPSYVYSLIETGETSGKLAKALEDCSDQMVKELKLRMQIKNAFTYPIFLFIVFIGALFFMIYAVIPQFASMIENNEDLPIISKFFFGVSEFAVNNNWLFLIIIIAIGVLPIYLWKTPYIRDVLEKLVWKIPVINSFLIAQAKESWARLHFYSLDNGVSVLKASELAINSLHDGPFKANLYEVARRLRQGEAIDAIYQDNNYMTAIDIGMLKAGVASGNLTIIFKFLSEDYMAKVENALKKIIALIEPMLIVIITLMVGMLAIAIFTAIPSIYEQIN